MSTEKITPKDLFFSKTDRRVLLRTLEKYYATQLKLWQFHASTPKSNLTQDRNFDRRFRLSIKPVELLLHALGSEFMSNVKPSSIRKTFDLVARADGSVQSERQTLDYFHRIKRKRNCRIQVSASGKRSKGL